MATHSVAYSDKPHNPMVNAGAILLCALLKPLASSADRFDYVRQF
jgi:glutaminase